MPFFMCFYADDDFSLEINKKTHKFAYYYPKKYGFEGFNF